MHARGRGANALCSRAVPTRRATVSLGLLVAAVACSSAPTDETPAGALTLFVEAMERGRSEREALATAYHLLATPAREALRERARRATELGGRAFEPWDMLPPGRFRLRFEPVAARTVEEIDGPRARVTLTGSRGETAVVPMHLEGDGWRVALELPPREAP